MAYSKITLLAALAAIAYAQTQAQINELNVALDDVMTNINDYITLSSTPNSGLSLDQIPAGIMDIAGQLLANQVMTPTPLCTLKWTFLLLSIC